MSEYAWINSYVGIPYAYFGDGIESANCYSLLRRIFWEQRGIRLPDWNLDDSDLRTVIRTLRTHVEQQVKLGHARPVYNGARNDWDIVTVEREGKAHHIGLYIANGVLHADRGFGSRWESVWSFQERYENSDIRWWRWPCE